MEETTTKRSSKKSGSKPYRIYLLALVAVLVIAVGGYYGYKYWQNKQNNPATQTAAEAAAADAQKKDILGKLSKLMVLPEGDPVLFKVNDQETMRKQQAFFKDTMNDDVLLVFQQSSKAIIYRPSTNMIVNVGPINFDQTKTGTSAPTTPTTPTASTTKTTTKK